jgi:CHASE2 domain-containing sensor protein
MAAIFVLIMSCVAGAIGWWVGEFFGFMPALVISTVASVFGVYYGQRINREYFGY